MEQIKFTDVQTSFVRIPPEKVHGGSAFLVDPEGLAFTCRHVLKDRNTGLVVDTVECEFKGKSHMAEVLDYADKDVLDFALIKLYKTDEELLKFPTVELTEEPEITEGTEVRLVGYDHKYDSKPVRGFIVGSLTKKTLDVQTKPINYLLIDAEIEKGMSGGPVFHMARKKVIAITCRRIKQSKQPILIPMSQIFNYILDPQTFKVPNYFKERIGRIREQIASDNFENQVAELYHLMGYKVEQNVDILGHKIDILFTVTMIGGITVKVAVACKYVEGSNLQKNTAMEYILALRDLKNNDIVQDVFIVTTQGFTKDLWETARKNKIKLKTFGELQRQAVNFTPYLKWLIQDFETDELKQYYVDLIAKDQKNTLFKPIDTYIQGWLNTPHSNHVSILGEYGTGKTSFCRKLAYDLAQACLKDPFKNRIPILITLRDYSKVVSIPQLITDFLVNRYGLQVSFALFEKLNENGLFVLLFDGFDEMSQRVIYDVARANFIQIAELADPSQSKVILTCRTEFFRNQEKEQAIFQDFNESQNFDIIYLQEFTEDQIQEFLQKRVPLLATAHPWEYYYQKIQDIFDLQDLAKRPVLLELITKYLPKLITKKKTISVASLYETVIEKEIVRRTIGETMIEKKDRLRLMRLLARWMCRENVFIAYFADIPHLLNLQDYFDLATIRAINEHLHDFLTCSFLNRDPQGNYKFSHRSFMEYLVVVNIAYASPKDRPELVKEIEKYEPTTQRALGSLGSKEFYEALIQESALFLKGTTSFKTLWLQAWVNYHALEPKVQHPLPRSGVKADNEWLVRYKKTTLVTLNLSQCNLTVLPENVVAMLQEIEHLDLSGNQLHSLPENFGQLTRLKTLNLTNNPLQSLPQSFKNLTSFLSKKYPEIDPAEATVLFLIEILLSEPLTHLSKSKTAALGFITENVHVTELIVTFQKLITLPTIIGELINLKNLDLGYNRLQVFPKSITKLTNLQTLDLRYNRLQTLPASVTKLTNLQTLNLSGNQLPALPKSIGQLINLQTLDLRGNRLQTLPESVTELTNLQTLDLGGNFQLKSPRVIQKLKMHGCRVLGFSHPMFKLEM